MPKLSEDSKSALAHKKQECREAEKPKVLAFFGEEEAPHYEVTGEDTEQKFLLQNWIPCGAITGIIGEDSAGKSAFMLYGIIRPMITGEPWFNGEPGPKEPRNVLWCHTENDGRLTRQHIVNWGLPVERLKVPFSDKSERLDLALNTHIDILEKRIYQSNISLIAIDSLASAHGKNENDARMKLVMGNLAGIAERTNVGIIVTQPVRKILPPGRKLTLADCRGSSVITTYMKTVLGCESLDPIHNWKCVSVLKESFGVNHVPFGFKIGDTQVEFGEAPGRQREKDRRVTEWLKREMAVGVKYPSKEMVARGLSEGITETHLRRVAKVLKVEMRAIRKGQRIVSWTWMLPN